MRRSHGRPGRRVWCIENVVFRIVLVVLVVSDSERLVIGDNRDLVLGTILKRLLPISTDGWDQL